MIERRWNLLSVKIQADIWKHSKQKGSALLIMLAIGDFSDDEGMAFPSVKTLASKTKLSERGVQYLLKQLEKSGELSIEHGAGPKRCSLFRVQILQGANIAPVQTFQGEAHCTGGVQKRGVSQERKKVIQRKKERTTIEPPSPRDLRHSQIVAIVKAENPMVIFTTRDFSALKNFLATNLAITPEKFLEYWLRFVNSSVEYERQQGPSLTFFCNNINRFTEVRSNGKAKTDANTRAARDFVSRELAKTLQPDLPDVRENPRGLTGAPEGIS